MILGTFYFISNDLKGAMLGVTAGIAVYAVIVKTFGHIHISAKEEFLE